MTLIGKCNSSQYHTEAEVVMSESFVNHLDQNVLTERENERKQDLRSAYYRDTTAIIHSSPFRRLKHKTQVFFAPSNDHICTRIEHSLHVASIASTLSQGLGLDQELAWAIGMGHDLGHAPFGHVGESILSQLRMDRTQRAFEHELNSLRVVDFLADNGKGLNLTYAVRDGIVSHNGETFLQSLTPSHERKDFAGITTRSGIVPATWEGVIVRFSDQIAYLGRDYEDGCRLNIVQAEMLPQIAVDRLGNSNSAIIDTLVHDLLTHSSVSDGVGLSDEVFEAVLAMKRFNYEYIYHSPLLKGYHRYFHRLLSLIVNYLDDLFITYGFDYPMYESEKNMLAAGFSNYIRDMANSYQQREGGYDNLIIDYVAGMSDTFALDCADEILKPTHLNDDIERSLTGKWFDVR